MFSYHNPLTYSPFAVPRRQAYYPSMEDRYNLALAQEQELRRRQAILDANRRQSYIDEMNSRRRRRPMSYSWFGEEESDGEEDDYSAAIMAQKRAEQQRRRMYPQPTRARANRPITIPIYDTPSSEELEQESTSSRSPSPPTMTQPTPAPTPSPDYNVAAQTIQSHWRKYQTRSKALRTIASIRARFDALRASFTLPTYLDFAPSDPNASTPPTLLYTPTNKPLHAYEHALTSLLTDIDGVQSSGNLIVRDARKKLVRDVENVLEGLDGDKRAMWEAMQPAPTTGEAGGAQITDVEEGRGGDISADHFQVAALPFSDIEVDDTITPTHL